MGIKGLSTSKPHTTRVWFKATYRASWAQAPVSWDLVAFLAQDPDIQAAQLAGQAWTKAQAGPRASHADARNPTSIRNMARPSEILRQPAPPNPYTHAFVYTFTQRYVDVYYTCKCRCRFTGTYICVYVCVSIYVYVRSPIIHVCIGLCL